MNEARKHGLLEELAKCMRCGFCQAACPVYREEGTEFSVARGKLILVEAVLDGRSPLSPAVRDALDACLLCKSCRAACPSGVRTDVIMAAGREMAAERYGLGALKAGALATLSRPKRMTAATALGARLWGLAFAKEEGADLWRLRVRPGSIYPRLPKRSLVARLADGELGAVAEPGTAALVISRPGVVRTVVFFPGCLVNYMLPEVGLATIKVLLAAGARVVVPASPTCCGTPLYVNGERAGASRLAEINLAWLARTDASLIGNMEAGPDGQPGERAPVVFSCPSCAESWRGYPALVEGRAAEEAGRAAKRVVDVSVFLSRSRVAPGDAERAVGDSGRVTDFPPKRAVTYHDPCHLAQAQGVRGEPRALLGALPGVTYREMADASACCGSGGTFGLFHPDLSRRIGGRKAADIAGTGADTVATGCPACMLQLRQELRLAGRGQVAVKHTVELLAEALPDV